MGHFGYAWIKEYWKFEEKESSGLGLGRRRAEYTYKGETPFWGVSGGLEFIINNVIYLFTRYGHRQLVFERVHQNVKTNTDGLDIESKPIRYDLKGTYFSLGFGVLFLNCVYKSDLFTL